MENKDAAKRTIDELLAYENRITGGERANLFGAQTPRDIMMDRDFTDFLARLDISGFTAASDAGLSNFKMDGESPEDFKKALEDSNYEALQNQTFKLMRIERFSPGLINSLYQDGYFEAFFNKLKDIKAEL